MQWLRQNWEVLENEAKSKSNWYAKMTASTT